MNFLKDCKITRVSNSAVAAQTAVTTSILDMSGFDSVIFIAELNTVTDACVLSLKVQQNTLNQTGGMADITGATTGNVTASGNSNSQLAVEVYRPQQRFVQAVLGRTTQNAVVDSILAIQFNDVRGPITQVTTAAALIGSNFTVPTA